VGRVGGVLTMPAQQQHWIRTAYLSGSTGTVAVGKALVSNGTAYVVATTANRTSYGRSEGIAITAGDDDDTAIEIQSSGVAPNSITGLGAGTATWVIVNSTGGLDRDASPDSGEDVIGKCNARGDLWIQPGVWDETNTLGGGGGGGTPGGSDNQFQYNNGGAFGGTSGLTYNEATNRPIAVNGVEFTDGANTLIVDGTPTGSRTLTLPDATDTLVGKATTDTLTNKSIALGSNTVTGTSAQLATAISDETGSGALVFADTPTLVTPNIGAATGTSAALSSFCATGATPAVTGQVRLTNADLGILGKDLGGTDRNVVSINTSNLVDVGDTALTTYVRGATGTSTGGVNLQGGSSVFQFQNNRALFPNTALPWFTDSDGTSFYKFAVSNLAADRTVTLPLLTGNDTFVFNDFAATLTNKTINGASNTLTVRIANDVSGLGANVATMLGTFSSANIRTACTDETGTGGGLVFANSATMDSPTFATQVVLSTSGMSTIANGNSKVTEYNKTPVNVQTTDATVTTLDSYVLGSNVTCLVTWLVVATRSTMASAAAYSVSACFRNNAGTVAQVGTTTTTVIGEDVAGWDATADNSGTTIRLRVTGAASTTIQWGAVLTRLEVIP